METKNQRLDQEAYARICKALGHPVRVMIVQYLKEIDRCLCGEIVSILPLAQSTVSQHLKCLKEADLIIGEIDGVCTCYCLNREMLARFKQMSEDL